MEGLLPDKYADEYAKIKPYGFMILIALISLGWIDPRLNILGRLLSFAMLLTGKIFGIPI